MLWELLTAPVSGLLWIAETIEEKALAEQQKENLHKKLMALQLQFDLGEISEAEFITQEQALLEAIAAQTTADVDHENP